MRGRNGQKGSIIPYILNSNVFVVKIGTLAGVPKEKLSSCTGATPQSASSPIIDTDTPLYTRAVVFLGLGGSVQPGESSLSTVFALLTIILSPADAHRHTLVPAVTAACVRTARPPALVGTFAILRNVECSGLAANAAGLWRHKIPFVVAGSTEPFKPPVVLASSPSPLPV